MLRAAFCTDNVCPGSLVQDCGFSQSVGVLNAANLRYFGKVEVWLENTAHSLLVGFYDVAIELPLNAQAVAGDSLPITVTLNTDLVTVNTPVTGLGLLKSYLMLCPGQDVPQQVSGGGNTIGSLTDASGVTDVYVGETYCMQHVIPALPSNVALTAHKLYSNNSEVLTVPGACAARRHRQQHAELEQTLQPFLAPAWPPTPTTRAASRCTAPS